MSACYYTGKNSFIPFYFVNVMFRHFITLARGVEFLRKYNIDADSTLISHYTRRPLTLVRLRRKVKMQIDGRYFPAFYKTFPLANQALFNLETSRTIDACSTFEQPR